jgi:hypothetical protein
MLFATPIFTSGGEGNAILEASEDDPLNDLAYNKSIRDLLADLAC